jgi:protocatechuate 3,4-dioxygenase alpha subunit
VTLTPTPSQTVGPFFSIGLAWEDGPFVVPEGTPGSFWIRGVVYDGAGDPVPDAVIESWQPNPEGRFADAGFRGFGRSGTDDQGRFTILTMKPGPVDGAPHIDVSVFARGLLQRVVTRIYFSDEDAANAADPALAALSEPARATLIAAAADDGYRFDIRLQGERETVFFDV